MAKHRSNGRKRGSRNVWEVFWEIGPRKFLVQETNYAKVIRRMAALDAQPELITRHGYRQVGRR